MKAVDSSSSYASSSLLNIMIPQFQQLLPLETPASGSWLNTHYSSERTNKLSSPPISITPSSICTDLSECEYQPIDLSSSSSHKYSFSSPPLSNIKSESIDLIDCSTMIISNSVKKLNSSKPKKPCSNFTIDHLLSSSFRSSICPYKQPNSIFSKIKTRHFSDKYLHRIIHQRKHSKPSYFSQYSIQPRGLFLRHIFDSYHDLINQQNPIKTHEKNRMIDPLEQLAEIACKIDTRQKKSRLNEDLLTSKNLDLLFKQCHLLIKKIYQTNQYKKLRKRLNENFKLKSKNRFLHFLLSILNLLKNCHILMSDIPIQIQNQKTKSICFYFKSDQIRSNLEILIPTKGLLYEAIIQPIDQYDDLLLVRLNHERQTYLIPIHDLCRLACPKMIPEDFHILSKGLRVCAYWSTSLRGLHPAIVKKIPSEMNESPMVSLLFDDGDTGLIKLEEIRLLPDDYDVQGINLDEWRVSSFQIPSSLPITHRTCRRMSSTASMNTNSSVRSIKKPKSSIVVPQWTLNPRNSTICRHDKKQILRVGDCVVLHGVEKSLSYIGKVLKFYHNKSSEQDLVKLKWYYSPQETPIGLHENDLPGALYESTHIDENPISTIRSKGTIYRSYDDYVKKTASGQKRKDTDFYLVGHYNPTTSKLQRYDNN